MRLFSVTSGRLSHDTRLPTRAACHGNGSAIMRCWLMASLFTTVTLSMLFAAEALANPPSGIVVNARGEVFFPFKGVCKIDAEGKVTQFHNGTGRHHLVLDVEEKFSTQYPRLFVKVTPEGVKPALLVADGGPFVVNRDGNLYYASGYPDGDDMDPGFL